MIGTSKNLLSLLGALRMFKSSQGRGGTALRLPWIKKPQATEAPPAPRDAPTVLPF